MSADLPDLVDLEEAARLLEVSPDRVMVLVQDGLLDAVTEAGDLRFDRGEVVALRELGG